MSFLPRLIALKLLFLFPLAVLAGCGSSKAPAIVPVVTTHTSSTVTTPDVAPASDSTAAPKVATGGASENADGYGGDPGGKN